jgi:hypothetical protein
MVTKRHLITAMPDNEMSKAPNALFHNLTCLSIPRPLQNLLNKGAKYIPQTAPPPPAETYAAFAQFELSLHLALFFHQRRNRNNHGYVPQLYTRNPVQWQPPWTFNSARQYVQSTRLDITTSYRSLWETEEHLQDPEIRAAAQFLKTNPHLKIVPTDKNLGLALITKKRYKTMVMDHLADANSYEYLCDKADWEWSVYQEYERNQLNNWADMLPHGIRHLQRFLKRNENQAIPLFHILPKVHKQPILARPIAGAHSWYTTEISKLLSHLLRTYYMPSVPHILRDSQQLINQSEGIALTENDLIVTLDVVALYPSIDQDKLIQAMARERPHSMAPYLDWSLSATQFIFDNAMVEFDDKVYRQTNGITMGTNAAVELANIYVSTLIERRIQETITEKMKLYKRFIDDIFFIWQGTLPELHAFMATLNTLEPSLKFTLKYSTEGVEFLDVFAFKHNNRLCFRTYQKPMNKYAYIPFDSNHPAHCKKGFVKGELLRYVRTNTRETDYNTMRTRFLSRLRVRGYPTKYLNNISRTVNYADRNEAEIVDLLQKPIFYNTKFHPIFERMRIGRKLRRLWEILPHHDRYRPITCYRKQRNVAGILTSSTFN